MASEMYVDTIAASDGTSPATLTKQSAAKCFLQFDQSDNGVDGSLNVSSVTDNGVGDITNNFSSSFVFSGVFKFILSFFKIVPLRSPCVFLFLYCFSRFDS